MDEQSRNPRVPVFFLSFEEGLFHIIHKLSTVFPPLLITHMEDVENIVIHPGHRG